MRSSFKKGFTLVEMVAVVGIFTLLTSIVIANFRTGNRLQRLTAAADELAANIKRTQGLAYANTKQMICSTDNLVCKSGSACDAGYPTNCVTQAVARYGIAIDIDASDNKYVIGADYAGLGAYVAGETVPVGYFVLPSGFVINSITPTPTAGNYTLVYVYDAANASPFVACSADCTTTIVLRDTVTSATKSVIVQKVTGSVYVQ